VRQALLRVEGILDQLSLPEALARGSAACPASPLRRKLMLGRSVRRKLLRTLDVGGLLREQFRCISQLRAAPGRAEPGSWS
jgi:hypothetical protein